ncbi:hypothetical protein ABZ446_43940 [Streptomyces sp. NPDC005813]|uniref:hypothetical protein n=1 Tax=Streptomyces sp. NPDC005813 TaxID=3155592 RepID=UPI0033C6C9E6
MGRGPPGPTVGHGGRAGRDAAPDAGDVPVAGPRVATVGAMLVADLIAFTDP